MADIATREISEDVIPTSISNSSESEANTLVFSESSEYKTGSNVIIKFKDLRYVTNTDVEILHSISGEIRSGDLIALMGPSGAGKTTLLRILSGRYTYKGEYTINGHEWHPTFKQLIGYCPQEDSFYPDMTVRETFAFHASLRLPNSWSLDQKQKQIDGIVQQLRLEHTLDNILGTDEKTLSGGELRRISVGLELLVEPPILILDEPTSGLDSATASDLIKLLAELAYSRNIIIIVSLHQPSFAVYSLFTGVVFLAGGHLVYMGLTSDSISYFKHAGMPCPQGVNIADHIMDVLSDDNNIPAILDVYNEQIKAPFFFYKTSRSNSAIVHKEYLNPNLLKPASAGVPLMQKIYIIILRGIWPEIKRMATGADALQFGALVVIQLLVYFKAFTHTSSEDFYTHIGQIYGFMTGLCFRATFGELHSEGYYKNAVKKEIDCRMYGHHVYSLTRIAIHWIGAMWWPIFTANLIYWGSSIPMNTSYFLIVWGFIIVYTAGMSAGLAIAVFVRSFTLAADVAVSFTLFMILPSGTFTSIESLPKYMEFSKYISYVLLGGSAIGIAAIDKSGMEYDCDINGLNCQTTGKELLRAYGVEWEYWQYHIMITLFTMIFFLIFIVGVRWGPQYGA